MEASEFEKYALEYVKGELRSGQIEAFEKLLKEDESRQAYVAELREISSIASEWAPELPDQKLRQGFYEMLAEHESGANVQKAGIFDTLESFLKNLGQYKQLQRLTFTLMVAVISGFIGFQLNSKAEGSTQVLKLSEDLEGMKQAVAMLQLKSYSPTDRIKGVSYIRSSNIQDNDVLSNLIEKMTADENLHVRIAAAQTLFDYRENPLVQAAFLRAISMEKEMMGLANLIKIALEIDAESAMDAAQRIIEDDSIRQDVKDVVEELVNTQNI